MTVPRENVEIRYLRSDGGPAAPEMQLRYLPRLSQDLETMLGSPAPKRADGAIVEVRLTPDGRIERYTLNYCAIRGAALRTIRSDEYLPGSGRQGARRA